MTNKEIKFELAKVALERCAFSTREELNESLKNLYEWVVEESEVEEETEQKSSFDDIDIKDVLNIIRKNKRFSSGIATSLEKIFYVNKIKTVGDLVRIGRREFSTYRFVGKTSILAVDDAFEKLGIKGW